jgi:FkbM family methyltransferase
MASGFACGEIVIRLQPLSTTFTQIDAVKIDVEGHENSVLRGMKEFLKHHRPKLVMFEYLRFRDSANRN